MSSGAFGLACGPPASARRKFAAGGRPPDEEAKLRVADLLWSLAVTLASLCLCGLVNRLASGMA